TRGQASARRAGVDPVADTPSTELTGEEGQSSGVPGMDEVSPASGQIGSPAESGIVEPVSVDLEPGGETPPSTGAPHVPVKRKRTRKH
ncbi:MAG: hypothetical protein WB471_09695, partial [Nocardioides sp.]